MDKEIEIKLNHIYDGTLPVTKSWIFDDFNPFPQYKSVKPIKRGEVIGDLCFHGKILQNYLHEYRKLGFLFMTPGIEYSQEYQPYFSYIRGQINRWMIVPEGEENTYFGSCRKFQMGMTDRNFAIDTTGEYCQCNLIDSSVSVKNPEGRRPESCNTCEYSRQSECFPCGSEALSEICEHNYAWCQMLEEFAQLREVFELMSKEDNKDKEPVYCVKNYSL